MSIAISIKDCSKVFGEKKVLDNINLDIEKGELVCLLGPSGCGKSTLLRLIAGLEKPSSGSVYLGGRDASSIPPAKRNFGIVFQSYALFPNLTAFENVAYGLRNQKVSQATIHDIVNTLFETINLTEGKNRYPSQLSGGEQQRVALARALAVSPDFLLLDEPLSALDAKVRNKLRREICEIQKKMKLTTIMVTHDQDEALTMADRIVVMDRAKIMQIGKPEDIYEQPKNRFVADFIGSINFADIDGVSCGIRPEHIIISKTFSKDSMHVKVKHIEFRGNFCRVTVQKVSAIEDVSLAVDMPYSQLNSLGVRNGCDVFLSFPTNKLLRFAH